MLVVKKYKDGWFRGIRCRDYQVRQHVWCLSLGGKPEWVGGGILASKCGLFCPRFLYSVK